LKAEPNLLVETTSLLLSASVGDGQALDRLLPLVYEELRRLAHGRLAAEHPDHTLVTTALVHEAYLRLVDDDRVAEQGRRYFFAAASRAMRRVLVDHARRRKAVKRGGGMAPEALDEEAVAVDAFAAELIDLDDALKKLAGMNPRRAQIVECRFFGGMNATEAAEALGISRRTVMYEWGLARRWLHDELADKSRVDRLDNMDGVAAARLVGLGSSSGDLETLGPFELVEELGRGGMGEVYLARDSRSGEQVALKHVSFYLGLDRAAQQRFRGDLQAASVLDHPNIVRVLEVGETEEGRLYIAMTHYSGKTLRKRFDGHAMSPGAVAGLGRQIADGLAAAHARGIIHRDVKPSNVLLTPEGDAKLLDFDVATVEGLEAAGAISDMGTVAYMSPERTRGQGGDARSDLWSLGVILYEALAGSRPFAGPTTRDLIRSIREGTPPDLAIFRPTVPPPLERLIVELLEKDPARRPGTAVDVSGRLAELAV
jgi:RNA polymerase sigma factor (TIGR02999 family)